MKTERTIVTASDWKYRKFAERLVFSLRGIGWREGIDILTEDARVKIPSARTVITEQTYRSAQFNDNRWLQFDICKPYKDGTRICYIDADCVATKHADLESLFSHDFACPTTYDGKDPGMPVVIKCLNIKNPQPADLLKFIETPFVCTVNEESRKFFNLCNTLAHINKDRGTMVPFNIACRIFRMPEELPQDMVFYWQDIAGDDTQRMEYRRYAERIIDVNAWFVHYGGSRFKRHWEREYFENNHFVESGSQVWNSGNSI